MSTLIQEYKSMRAEDFPDPYTYQATRIEWIKEKIERGELEHGSETHEIICNMPGQ